jgi:hypothetical protein
MHKLATNIILVFCILGLSVSQSNAEDTTISREYKIKTDYLFNLIKFISWPVQSNQRKPITTQICIYGVSPFDRYLDKLSNKKAKGRAIKISYIDYEKSIDSCTIIFVPRPINTADLKFSKALLNDVGNKPILTVGESNHFLDQGGLINLAIAENNVQLHINLTKAKGIGFEISGNLLEIAKVIK